MKIERREMNEINNIFANVGKLKIKNSIEEAPEK